MKIFDKSTFATEEDKQRASEAQTNYFNNNPDKMKLQVAKLNSRRIENPTEWAKEHSEKMNTHYDKNTDAGMEAREKASKKSIEQFERSGQREKASEVQKRRFEKQGAREKASEIQKIRYAKPGAIEKISEAAKKRHGQPGAKEKLLDVMLRESISGPDIIKSIQKEVWNLQIDDELKVRLTEKTGEIEFRLVEGSDEFIQLEALLASFILAGKGIMK